MATTKIQLIPPGFTDVCYPQTTASVVIEETNKKFMTDEEKTKLANFTGNLITSVFSRTGEIVAAAGDYTASLITNTPSGNIVATTVQAAINELDLNKEPIISAKGTAFNRNFGTTLADVKVNGTAALGILNVVARIDHVHPTDTSRASTSVATIAANGLMSKDDKTKLDTISTGANKVVSSTTNGNIIIDGVDTIVYTHPTGTNPHGLTRSDLNLENVTNESKTTMFTSPVFTDIPTAPTAIIGTNTNQLATTAFVQSAVASAGGGDMMKSVYDSNSNNIVDRSETADKFTTAITINGVSFDGSSNITIYDNSKVAITLGVTQPNSGWWFKEV